MDGHSGVTAVAVIQNESTSLFLLAAAGTRREPSADVARTGAEFVDTSSTTNDDEDCDDDSHHSHTHTRKMQVKNIVRASLVFYFNGGLGVRDLIVVRVSYFLLSD